jgi:hypothetical protein
MTWLGFLDPLGRCAARAAGKVVARLGAMAAALDDWRVGRTSGEGLVSATGTGVWASFHIGPIEADARTARDVLVG